ncbi:DeoR family transcriptional regulator of aga operon [Kibdelosporangium banguiense]|uniref:DeoR family transcriptional regulator of aga operon n=1 Tax=Kibdelosporangium banguiense TaxID=1365924 RepID=A0ABS4TV48_9PSEU|nr:DeoR/GlpR family DNA-binding transcription regulator [Kibdelosporangium banguiense]MBP2328243.1 DeoR family transcriptional regulator of aga operon [Kibdelosporangium banguiense]
MSDSTDFATAGRRTRKRRTTRAERMSEVLRVLGEAGSLHVGELCARFGVSSATLRRDLAKLEEQRLLTRTHGGALAQGQTNEVPVPYRESRSRDAKRAIVRAAIRTLPTGSHVIALTGGSTTSELARELPGRADLTVVTNALNIAMELAMHPRLKLVVVGGVARPQSYELVGPWAEHVLASISIGTAFIGVDGIDASAGITTHDENEARTNHAMLGRARRVVVLADGSKIGQTTLARMGDIQDVHEVITDQSAAPEAVAAIQRAGVRVTVVEVACARDS